MYRHDSDTPEQIAAGIAELEAGVCPKCKGPLEDLRNIGFNSSALKAEGTCFRYDEESYNCST